MNKTKFSYSFIQTAIKPEIAFSEGFLSVQQCIANIGLSHVAHYLFKLKLESHIVGLKIMYRCLQSFNLIVGRRNLKFQRRSLGCQSNHVTIQCSIFLSKQVNCVLVSAFLLESVIMRLKSLNLCVQFSILLILQLQVVSTAVELDFQSFVTTSDVVHLALEFFALDTPLIMLHAL
ncbi:hypothetical protein PsorP6_018882 [Peronosclerospora sorghi]|nr:hypothetical protein PsorP6_018882 [Peronosclerospora sorghi]